MCTEGKRLSAKGYFDTYAPVATWFAIRRLIIYDIVLIWQLRQVELIMAYSQALIKCDMCFQLPDGIETNSGNSRTNVLKLLQNLYS